MVNPISWPSLFNFFKGRRLSLFFKISLLVTLFASYVCFLRLWIDPRPVAPLAHSFDLGRQSLPAAFWLDTEPLTPPFTVQLQTEWTAGEKDVLYGFMVGSPARPLSIAISPLGYMEITHAEEVVTPFSIFPHLKPNQNELWLDVYPHNWCLRLNQELAACGEWHEPASQVGFTGRSFGSTATLKASLLIFYPPLIKK